MAEVYSGEILKDKALLDSETGNPLKEIRVEEDKILAVKESGSVLEIPINSVRAKHILMRLNHGIGELTEPLYL